MVIYLAPDAIRRDEGRFQLRARTCPEAIDRLTESMRAAGFSELHPLVVWRDDAGVWWLVDGFHRLAAAMRAGVADLPCTELHGTLKEALAFGVAQNRDHGRQLDEKTDFRYAAKRLREAGMTYDEIAQTFWPLDRSKWTAGRNHPRGKTISTWLSPTSAARYKAASKNRQAAYRLANDLIQDETGAAPAALQDGEYATALEAALASRISKAEAKAAREAELEEAAYRIKSKLLDAVGEVPDWAVRASVADSNRGVPCTIWSDWHWGEVVRRNGEEVFNRAIATERVRRLVERTISLCFNHMGKAEIDYPGIVVMLGGDMIGGDIHEELAATNELTAAESIIELRRVLVWALTQMADAFGRVFVPCVVGNHGRTTKKPQFKDRTETSFETVLYAGLKDHFETLKDERVKFFIPRDFDARFDVAGTRYLLTHGDAIGTGGGDGIIGAIGPISRGTFKVRNAEISAGDRVDVVVMGHWHQPLWLPHAIVNNSLKGDDEYAKGKLRAPYSRASQQLWFTHPLHGITARWEVFLETRDRPAPSSQFVAWDHKKGNEP